MGGGAIHDIYRAKNLTRTRHQSVGCVDVGCVDVGTTKVCPFAMTFAMTVCIGIYGVHSSRVVIQLLLMLQQLSEYGLDDACTIPLLRLSPLEYGLAA